MKMIFLRPISALTLVLIFVTLTDGQSTANTTDVEHWPNLQFGKPQIFAITRNQHLDYYRLINKYKRTFLYEEYVINAETRLDAALFIVMFDATAPNVVAQNLGKEFYWTFLNATGVFAEFTIQNATLVEKGQFQSVDSGASKEVAFFTRTLKTSSPTETIPPYDIFFEFPGGTRSYKTHRTFMDLQSWGLLRWQLSDSGVVTWAEIMAAVEALRPKVEESTTLAPPEETSGSEPVPSKSKSSWNISAGDFEMIVNPCFTDMFILYIIVGDKNSSGHQIYADIPVFHLADDEKNFINLTGAFCPNRQELSHEECGYVSQLVLTNGNLIALTDKGIYVSADLKTSDKDASLPYEEKPLLSYVLVDPCESFDKKISCFKQGKTQLSYEMINSVKLYYTPICRVWQLPEFEDRLIFVIEHTIIPNNTVIKNFTEIADEDKEHSQFVKEEDFQPVRALTVLYAGSTSPQWHALFIGLSTYEDKIDDSTDGTDLSDPHPLHIVELVGIFFNHQYRHFDITIKVVGEDRKNVEYRRFVLPDPEVTEGDAFQGYEKLNGLLGKGFVDKKFPGTFDMREVVVNPGSMDVFFLGNQLWIAESGFSIVYKSLGGLPDESFIRACSFNHPDRFYVCSSSSDKEIILGRVGSHYEPSIVAIDSIPELWEAAGPTGGHWTQEYTSYVIENSYFTAAYSGKILMWYLFDADELRKSQKKAFQSLAKEEECESTLNLTRPQLLASCKAFVAHTLANDKDWLAEDQISNAGAYFRMISVDPNKLDSLEESTDGPLVPLFVDSNTVILFEAALAGEESDHVYFSTVSVGKVIECRQFPKSNTDAQRNCEIYIRHIKPVDKYLEGFRQILYGTIIKPIVFEPLESAVVVLQIPDSNRILVNFLHNDFVFTNDHIGWTLYIPGKFSILLKGFPILDETSPKFAGKVMWGFSTVHVRKLEIIKADIFETYLIDMSTKAFRKQRIEITNQIVFEGDGGSASHGALTHTGWSGLEPNKEDWLTVKEDLTFDHFKRLELEDKIFKIKEKINAHYKDPEKNKFANPDKRSSFVPFENPKPKSIQPLDPLILLKSIEDEMTLLPSHTATATINRKGALSNPETNSWITRDGGCHHVLKLEDNPVLFDHGGRIHLDLHESVSLRVTIRPITEVGRLTMYRPLFVVTNSNPDVLRVERRTKNDRNENTQTIDVTLSPTGARTGVSTFVVRSVIASLKCTTPTSITYIVQCYRANGKRLFINYPIPTCQSSSLIGWSRPWKKNVEYCIPPSEILDAGTDPKTIEIKRGPAVIFTKLQPNYRPPSIRGEKIPLSKYTYNADPSKPDYNSYYHITNDTKKLRKCSFRKNRAECKCTDAERMSDHPDYSDCKEMVFTIQRAKSFNISIEYDPEMRREDQNKELFSGKEHLSVFIEEINGREEFTIHSESSPVLSAINDDPRLNKGKKFYSAENLTITLHGTGLFHFKAGLGLFDSFDEVSGYFILYSQSSELNHIKLVVVMLLTITFCFSLIFFGFLRVRKRLSSQLPFQTRAKAKFKLE